jgi:hypothetical protein
MHALHLFIPFDVGSCKAGLLSSCLVNDDSRSIDISALCFLRSGLLAMAGRIGRSSGLCVCIWLLSTVVYRTIPQFRSTVVHVYQLNVSTKAAAVPSAGAIIARAAYLPSSATLLQPPPRLLVQVGSLNILRSSCNFRQVLLLLQPPRAGGATRSRRTFGLYVLLPLPLHLSCRPASCRSSYSISSLCPADRPPAAAHFPSRATGAYFSLTIGRV